MMHGNCRCFHHWITKLMAALVWLSGLAFLWTSWKGVMVWGFDAEMYFEQVVVLALLAFSTKFCGCCGKGKMMSQMDGGMGGMCKHEMGCTCGDCGRCKQATSYRL